MKNTLLLIISLSFIVACNDNNLPEKPNIIVILADDMGYEDAGCYGSKDIPTPNIDKLAENGVRFTSGYVMMPYCGPSRAGLITGKHPISFGYYHNPTPVLATDQGLPPDCNTIGKYLQEQGYVTGATGKWHLGTTPDRHPNEMGFDLWYGFLGGARYYFPLSHYGERFDTLSRPWFEGYVNETLPLVHNSEQVKPEGYLTHVFTEKSVDFIRNNKDNPFYLFVSYNAPHTPLEAPESEIAKFPPDKVTQYEGIDPVKRGIYAAMVSEMDKGIGSILKVLKEEGIEENTMVWFLSDNGGYPHAASNYPLRGAKGSMYEGGIRVPFIISWPGVVKPGQVLDQPVTALDITATAFASTGKSLSETDLHGKDLMPLLLGKTKKPPHEAIFWKHGYGRKGGFGAMRKGDYKLVILQNNPVGYELYNLDEDLPEENDISNEMSDLAAELFAEWSEWDKKNADPLWIPPPREEWPEYQYADYDWLKGTPQYTSDPEKVAP